MVVILFYDISIHTFLDSPQHLNRRKIKLTPDCRSGTLGRRFDTPDRKSIIHLRILPGAITAECGNFREILYGFSSCELQFGIDLQASGI